MQYEKAIQIRDARHERLAGAIEQGKQDAQGFFQRMLRETPKDYLVNTGELNFDVRNGRIYVQGQQNEWLLHRHAVSQMVQKTGILTTAVANKMVEAATQDDRWGRDLLLHNLRTIFRKTERERVLLRTVPTPGGPEEVRGFLSDKYRRMDTVPIMDQFAETAMDEFGAVPISVRDGYGRHFQSNYYHDTKVGLTLFLPYVFNPIDSMQQEFLIIGIMVQNSDFGASALSVSLIAMRIICMNLMITQNELRKVHLGARLPEDIRFGDDTYAADTKTMALAVRDITRTLMADSRINAYTNRIGVAGTQQVNPDELFTQLRTSGGLLKKEAEEISKLYNTSDIELMPAGQTVWRATNAISRFANIMEETGNKERAVELRQTAGQVIDKQIQVAA